MKTKAWLLAGIASLALGAGASASGIYQGYPVMGGPQYCAVFRPSGTCTQYVPAGPGLSGSEGIAVDTGLPSGQNPQTAYLPLSSLPLNPKKNWIRGGDFGTNLWQRGTTPLSAVSPATYLMGADGWFAISASNGIAMLQDTPASTAANYLGTKGFLSWMKFESVSGTTGSNCTGQVLSPKDSQDFIGKNAVLSFYGYAPAAFTTDSGGTISVTIAYFTQASSTTPGTWTNAFANSLSGQSSGITGYTAAVGGLAGNTITLAGASVASGVATIPLTTTPTNFAMYAAIPTVNASGTAITGVGIGYCVTPTTAATGNFFELEAVQLQAMPSVATAPESPVGVVSPTGFERIPAQDEWKRELSFSYLIPEGGVAGVVQAPAGIYATATTLCQVNFPFPAPMRESPTLVATTAVGGIGSYGSISTSTFEIYPAGALTPLASTFAAIPTGGAVTWATGEAVSASVNFTTTAETRYDICLLASADGGGAILFNAEP